MVAGTALVGREELPDDLAGRLGHNLVSQIPEATGLRLEGDNAGAERGLRRQLIDLVRLPAEQLRAALEPIDGDELAIAMRTAGRKLQKKVLSSLPKTVARQVRQEMDRIGPVRLSDVEVAQRRVIDAIRQARYGRYVRETSRTGAEMLA